MLRSEIMTRLKAVPLEEAKERLFGDFRLDNKKKEEVITSLCSGHHLLILGPPGSGKTVLAEKISGILRDMEVVKDCPINCHPENPTCPWCAERKKMNSEITLQIVSASQRVKRVQGSPELLPEDLIGGIDPGTALEYGLYDIRTFSPGKLLRSNRGFLLLDFVDRIPERVLNVILCALEDTITIGGHEEKIPLDILIVATGGEDALKSLPIDMIDHFDIMELPYMEDSARESDIVFHGKNLDDGIKDKVIDIIYKTRNHSDVKRGVSTRGGMRFAELLPIYKRISLKDDDEILRTASTVSLPHRITVAPHAEAVRSPGEIIEEIVDDVLGGTRRKEDVVALTVDEIQDLIEEMVRVERFKRPLRMGYFDLLLRRIHRFPDSQLARTHKRVVDKLDEDVRSGNIEDMTEKILWEIEEKRKDRDKMFKEYMKRLEELALKKTIDMLEDKNILEKGEEGWDITRKAVSMLLEKLVPRHWDYYNSSGEGRHKTGKRLNLGEGRIVGLRKYRLGDRFRDVSVKDTVREAIRNRRNYITREDIMVCKKDIRKKLEIVIAMDLSGTMSQLDKLWYAKESAIALALACTHYKDRIGIVTFSNMADIIVEITRNPYVVARKVLDLELHENAFTNIGYGLSKARSLLIQQNKGEAKRHIVLISDGDANAPKPFPGRYCIDEAAKAIRKGITISCVCINEKSANPRLMREISRIGRGRVYMIGGTEELTPVLLEERTHV